MDHRDDRPPGTPIGTEEVMETFTLGLPQWAQRLRSRNPLLRNSDRVEALALVIAFTVVVLAIPVAGAIGTAVYDAGANATAGSTAVAVAVAVWAAAVSLIAAALAVTRMVCRRIRSDSWEREFGQLTGPETAPPT